MDIEDLPTDLDISNGRQQKILVKTRFKAARASNNSAADLNVSSIVPEKYHVFVQTWGCAHNTSDSEYMAGLLAQYGYRVTLGGSFQTHDTPADTTPDPPPPEAAVEHEGDTSSSRCACGSDDSCCQTKNENSKLEHETHDDGSGGACASSNVAAGKEELSKQSAHLWVLNSCTVKGPAEDHFRNAVQAGLRQGKRIVVAGCVPQSRPGANYLKGVSIIGVQQIDRIVEVVEETLQGNTVRFLDKKWTVSEDGRVRRRLGGASLDLPKIRRNPLIEILAISTGCLNACTYCKTKHARGVLASYSIEELLKRAEQAFEEGVKELWLTSEDLGAYGRDLDRAMSSLSCPSMTERFPDCLTLSDLLAGLVRLIPPGCMLRLGMTNPPYILEQLDEIAEVLRHPRVFAFLHIPVQSGSDAVLDAMKREYTAEEFAHVVNYVQSKVDVPSLVPEAPPGSLNGCGSLTVATDIICGFPNETDADFEATVSLVDRFKFPVLYINQFFARPGTPAANMPRKATTAEVKQRTRRLHDLFRSYRPYANRVGALVRVLVTEVSTDGRYWVGHTKAYEQVLVPKTPEVYGRIILVRIVECDKFYMRAEIVHPGPFDSLVPLDDPVKSLELKCLRPLEPTIRTAAAAAGSVSCVSPRVDYSPDVSAKRHVSTESKNVRFHWLFHVAWVVLLYAVLKFCESRGYLSLDRMTTVLSRYW